MDGKIGPRCGMLLSELAPDVESALDVENRPRLGTNSRSESKIYIFIYIYIPTHGEIINNSANMYLVNLLPKRFCKLAAGAGHYFSLTAYNLTF